MTNRPWTKNTYIPLHDTMVEDDQPYDTMTIDHMDKNNSYLYEKGNVTQRDFIGYQPSLPTNNGEYVWERPYCMVSQEVSIYQIPYLIQPGLARLEVSMHCRVSNGFTDANAGALPGSGHEVKVGVMFPDHNNKGPRQTLSPLIESGESKYFWTGEGSDMLDYDLTRDSRGVKGRGAFSKDPNVVGPFYSVLNLVMKSQGLTTGIDGKTDSYADYAPTTYNSEKITSATNAWVTPASGTFPNPTEPYTTGITVDLNALYVTFIGPYDLLSTPSANIATVWVPQSKAEEGIQMRNGANRIQKYYAPYIQIKSLVIREIYE